MTPLLPTPDHYLSNLIAMTSSEAKRLWRRSIKEHFDYTCIYCGKSYDLSQLSIDHVHPRSKGGKDIASNAVCACTNTQDQDGTPAANTLLSVSYCRSTRSFSYNEWFLVTDV